MTESHTPRTDAVFYSFHTHEDLVELARQLERELDLAQWDAQMTARDRDEWMTRAIVAQAKDSK